MPEPKYIPADAFAKVVKGQFRLLSELHLAVVVLRTTFLRSEMLRVSVEYLKGLEAELRASPEIREAAPAIEKIRESDSLEEFLKAFEGPIQ